MRPVLVLTGLTAALLAGCGMPDSIRVMTFNIRFANEGDGENAWSQRSAAVPKLILESGADIIGVQEALAAQVDQLAVALENFDYVGRGRGLFERDDEFVPIFFNKERFALVRSGHFWLSEKPRKPASMGWDAACPRLVTWVELRYRKSPLNTFFVFNAHFDHRGEVARRESAKMLRNVVESRAGNPVLVLGDFNTAPGSPPQQTLLEDRGNMAELYDPFIELQCEDEAVGTYHGFSGKPGNARIDWVLYNRRWRPLRIWIDQQSIHGKRWPSDHFPVLADLELLSATRWGSM